jgi:hypothetical protein
MREQPFMTESTDPAASISPLRSNALALAHRNYRQFFRSSNVLIVFMEAPTAESAKHR